MTYARTLTLLFCLGLWGSGASAHPLNLGYLQLKPSGSKISVTLQLNETTARELSKLSANDDLSQKTAEVFRSTLGKAEWESNGKNCPWTDVASSVGLKEQAGQFELTATADCEVLKGPLTVSLPFLASAARSFRVLGRLDAESGEKTFIADGATPTVSLRVTQETGFFEFIHMGIAHIGALPAEWYGPEGFHWPDGIDHILFVLALILGGGSARSLVKTISGFTIGHSITLGISALGLVHFPVRMVESFIALSIVYVAIEAVLLRQSQHRWRVAAAFGLFHGFGFASALTALELTRHNLIKAVIGFNIGVEAGQLVIIACVLPLVYFLKTRKSLSAEYVVRAAALGIAGAGSYWFIERAFF
jgi:hydrogenase/urease accessory protein HupE